MALSASMTATGLLAPLFMLAGWLPATLLTCFASLVLLGAGSLLLLTRCGEL